MTTTARRLLVMAFAATLLASCASGSDPDEPTAEPSRTPVDVPVDTSGAPLREGEEFRTVSMPFEYTPSAPLGQGTDDYRCFLLDPELTEARYLTGTKVLPGDADVVHHVILTQISADEVAAAQAIDAQDEGDGWTCFGGNGVERTGSETENSGWLAAWAPGSDESVFRRNMGIPLEPGTQFVLQVHYNLLVADEPDATAVRLRLAAPNPAMRDVEVKLFPAPVEVPCRPQFSDGELCERDAAMEDVKQRFGRDVGAIGDLLHLLCATPVEPSEISSCTRSVREDLTVVAVGGHMHLLGREITLVVNPGTAREHVLLEIPVWDFDDQGAKPIKPYQLRAGDKIEVRCRHDQSLRDVLPSFEGTVDRYIVWGEGTTDEMCLGTLLVVEPR